MSQGRDPGGGSDVSKRAEIYSFLGQLAGAENEHHRPNLFDLRCTK